MLIRKVLRDLGEAISAIIKFLQVWSQKSKNLQVLGFSSHECSARNHWSLQLIHISLQEQGSSICSMYPCISTLILTISRCAMWASCDSPLTLTSNDLQHRPPLGDSYACWGQSPSGFEEKALASGSCGVCQPSTPSPWQALGQDRRWIYPVQLLQFSLKWSSKLSIARDSNKVAD